MIKNFLSLFNYSLLLILLLFTYMIFTHQLFLFNYFLGWFVGSMLIFWLISMFKFFFKRYKFSKFTSSIQRFWRRTYNIFWMVEGCWFIVFIYCLIYANHESIHYEECFFYKILYLNSWWLFLNSIIIIIPIIIIIQYLMIFSKQITFNQIILYLLIITIFNLIYFFNEFYQFYNIITFFIEPTWIFSIQNNLFEINTDYWHFKPRLAFFSITLIVKFWHCIFILGSWLLFFIKTLEIKKIQIPMLAMNSQNIIIFYIMLWLPTIMWFKWFVKLFFRQFWYWFFMSPLKLNIIYIFSELKINIYALLAIFFKFKITINIYINWYFFIFNSNFIKTNFTLNYIFINFFN